MNGRIYSMLTLRFVGYAELMQLFGLMAAAKAGIMIVF